MKARVWFIPAIILGGLLLAAPPQAEAGGASISKALDVLGSIMSDLESAGIMPPAAGDSYGDVRQILTCIDTAKDDVTVLNCIEQFKDTSLGASLLSNVPSWFWDLVDIYVDIRTGNMWDLLEKTGEAIVCFVAQSLAMGIDICGIIEDLIDLAKDLVKIGEAIVAFLKDCAEALGEAWHDFECLFEDCHSMTGLQVAWRDWFQSLLVDYTGLNWRETGPFSTLCAGAHAVGSQAGTFCPQDYFYDHMFAQEAAALQIIHTQPQYNYLRDADVESAAAAFVTGVTAQWDSRILNPSDGWIQFLNAVRRDFLKAQSAAPVQSAFGSPNGAMWQSASAFESYMTNWCTTTFKQQNDGLFDHVDFWLTIATTVSLSDKAAFETTQNWCQVDFFHNRRGTVFLPMFTQYLGGLKCTPGSKNADSLWCPDPDSYSRCRQVLGALGLPASVARCGEPPQCPTFMGTFYCTAPSAYDQCVDWAVETGSGDPQKLCAYDTSVHGPLVAGEIRANLEKGLLENNKQGPPSQFAAQCTIDGQGSGAKPAYAAAQHANIAGGVTAQPAVVHQGAAAATTARLVAPHMPHTAPSVLDCPRPTLRHFCELDAQKAQTAYGVPNPLVTCTASHVDAKYQQQAALVLAYFNAPGHVRGQLESPDTPIGMQPQQQAQPFVAQTYDPLVLVSNIQSCPPGFACNVAWQESVDGVSVPTILRPRLSGSIAIPPARIELPWTITGPVKPQPEMGGWVTLPSQTGGQLTTPETLSAFEKVRAGWTSVQPVQNPTGACACSDTFGQIHSLAQGSANLIREGDQLSAALKGGRLNAAATAKATQRLNEINAELNRSLAQRNSLAAHYANQLKSVGVTVH
jgi:hypothetical protein